MKSQTLFARASQLPSCKNLRRKLLKRVTFAGYYTRSTLVWALQGVVDFCNFLDFDFSVKHPVANAVDPKKICAQGFLHSSFLFVDGI